MKKNSIKAVTFDLWETLLFERDGSNLQRTLARCRNLAGALTNLGIQTSPEQVDVALKGMISSILKVWEKDKDVSHLDQLRLIVEAVSHGTVVIKDEWIDELSIAYVSPIFEVRPYLNPDARDALESLQRRRKSMALICNTGLTPGIVLRKLLAEEGVAEYFDLMLFSDEVGIRKPDPAIFHLVASRLKMEPTEIVHVGDNLKTDVWGARKAGFKAIHFRCEEGHDKIAEADPNSLVSISRRLGGLEAEQIFADKTVSSLTDVSRVIEGLELAIDKN